MVVAHTKFCPAWTQIIYSEDLRDWQPARSPLLVSAPPRAHRSLLHTQLRPPKRVCQMSIAVSPHGHQSPARGLPNLHYNCGAPSPRLPRCALPTWSWPATTIAPAPSPRCRSGHARRRNLSPEKTRYPGPEAGKIRSVNQPVGWNL